MLENLGWSTMFICCIIVDTIIHFSVIIGAGWNTKWEVVRQTGY